MPTQQEAKVEFSLDEWIATFQGDARRNYSLEFLKVEGLDKNAKLLGNNDEELVVVTMTCVEDENLFIAISGNKKEFDLLNLQSVVKELNSKEEEFQSINISLGALTPEKSLAKRKEKIDSSQPVVRFITQSFSTDNETDSSAENLLKNRTKKSDEADKAVQFQDLESNAFFNKGKKKVKDEKKNNNDKTEKENNDKKNEKDEKTDVASMIAAAVAKADEVDAKEANNKNDDKKTEDDEFKSLDNPADFPDLDQNIFGGNDTIHAKFAELVECVSDCDVDIVVIESKLKDNKILINFKLQQMSEQIVRAKTVFTDSSYEKWNEFKTTFGIVNRKSKLVIEDDGDYDAGFLVDGTMATVSFSFKDFPKLNEKWKELVSAIEKNPVIENIVSLLIKDEEASVQVVDKLETECVVALEFKPKE